MQELPKLFSPRLQLRPISMEDKQALFELRSDREVMRYIPRPIAKEPEDAAKLITAMLEGIQANTLQNWAITLRETDTCIGVIGFYRMEPENHRAEVGYLLAPAYQGKGLMQEALKVVIEYGFNTLQLHTILAVIDPRNKASEKILLNNGFVKEGHFRENVFFEGVYLDSVYYTLFNPA